MTDIIQYTVIVISATLLKLSSSGDDWIWLSKLVVSETPPRRFIIESVYLFTLIIICALAYIFSIIGGNVFLGLFGKSAYFSVISSIALMLFAVLYLRRDEKNDENNTNSNYDIRKKILISFFTSFTGSIDELATYIVALSTNKISIAPLTIGTFIAGIIVISAVNGLGRIRLFVGIIEKLAVWAIIFSLGVISFIVSLFDVI